MGRNLFFVLFVVNLLTPPMMPIFKCSSLDTSMIVVEIIRRRRPHSKTYVNIKEKEKAKKNIYCFVLLCVVLLGWLCWCVVYNSRENILVTSLWDLRSNLSF